MQRHLVVTEDGSHSIYVPELNEHYHSIHGAIQESTHVFINAGLKAAMLANKPISVFEMGFGTGLNALLTLMESVKTNIRISYTALEAYPLESSLVAMLNYDILLDGEKLKLLHNIPWNTPTQINPLFSLIKTQGSLLDYMPQTTFDLIYFDAFAPEVQPELWTQAIFEKLRSAMFAGAILVTYCCKGSVKRALKSAGFQIEKLPGPPGKREILRATAI